MLSRMFHLSKEGTKTIIKAAVWLSLFQLATLLPVIPLARVSEQMMTCYFKEQQEKIPVPSLCGRTFAHRDPHVCHL